MADNDRKVAMVVGGSRGIGRAIALRLAKSGFDIWLTYKSNHNAADKVKVEVEKLGRSCDTISFDVSNYDATESALKERVGRCVPDVLVYNSGISRDGVLMWMKKEDWETVISTNLNGFYNVMRVVLFPMLQKKGGRIVVISSASGESGGAGQVNYSASKAGLIGAAKALAKEAGKNILVNVVSPGMIETDMTKNLPKEKIIPNIPLRRYGTPEEVAALVNFLCSDENTYIQGQVIGINGGIVI